MVRLLRRPVRRAGFDFELRSFYSPVPDLSALDDGVWLARSELPGIEFDLDRQLRYVEAELVSPGFVSEFRAPRQATGSRTEYYLENGLFGPGDAELLYAMIRRHRPAT